MPGHHEGNTGPGQKKKALYKKGRNVILRKGKSIELKRQDVGRNLCLGEKRIGLQNQTPRQGRPHRLKRKGGEKISIPAKRVCAAGNVS